MSMTLKTKTTVITTGIAVVMLLLITSISLISFRMFSLVTAREHARTAAEIVRVSLTEAMINGVVDKRESFLKRLSQVEGVINPRVFRGPDVVKQFGRGLTDESEMDSNESEVIVSGKAYYSLIEEGFNPVFTATIPFTADDQGTPNCLQCHHVARGTVLGAISLKISMRHIQKNALFAVGLMGAIIAFFGLLAFWFSRKLITPLVKTAEGVQIVVDGAVEGDFRRRVECDSHDEVGRIASGLNHLMNHLQDGFSTIGRDVAQLMRYDQPFPNMNLLVSTREMVAALVEAAHFKQAIEEDHDRCDVYQRLGRVLENKFGIATYSIYEVSKTNHHIVPVMVDGQMDGYGKWCRREVQQKPNICRAQRTGRIVDGVENPQICGMFQSGSEGQTHICIPLIQSGAVGNIVQLIVDRLQGECMQTLLPLVGVYLRDSAPVLESKRLMDTLRESALQDAMTGLHNRRFLEEYIDTMVATAERQKIHLAILMVDMDHFKKINDENGHDVGDIALKATARLLKEEVRASDLVIRYGGEEFLIILQETCRAGAHAVAEKIRFTMEKTPIYAGGSILKKTLSLGLACFPEDGHDFWKVLKCADQALYHAKQTGRNKVVIYSQEMVNDEVNGHS